MTQFDPALEEKILNIAQAQWKPNVEQHYEPDYFRRRVKISERVSWFSRTWLSTALPHMPHHCQPVQLL